MTIKRIGHAHTADIAGLLGDSTSWSIFVKKRPRKDENGVEVFANIVDVTSKFRDADAFTMLQMEAALCAWEWMCDNREVPLLFPFFDRLGSSTMRHCSMQAGDIALRVHDHMQLQKFEFVDAYDWEFIPGVLQLLDWERLTSDNQFGGPAYEPDIHEIFLAMFAADKAREGNPERRSFQHINALPDWLVKAKDEAKRQWAYEALVDDHAERAAQAYNSGEDPAEFVKWLGEKFALTPVSEQ